jgi:hypothetical protein
MKLKKDLPTSLYHLETPLFTANSKREVLSEVLSDLFAKHLPL